MDLVFPFDRTWPVPEAVQLACALEAAAPKAGNVHPQADFADMNFGHFLASAISVGSAFRQTGNCGVGELILKAVQQTQAAVGCNTNLGAILLLAPLAKACSHQSESPQFNIGAVLKDLNANDSKQVYAAIRLINPGGLGSASTHDVRDEAPSDLVQAMQSAAHFDAVARQYTNGFVDVFESYVPWLFEALRPHSGWQDAICELQLRILANEPDGLIHRKLGAEEANRVQMRAQQVWDAVRKTEATALRQSQEFQELDAFLRSAPDGTWNDHARNPGTTADLIAATLFVALVGPLPKSKACA